MDFNKLLMSYVTWGRDAEKQVASLKRILSDVPVFLRNSVIEWDVRSTRKDLVYRAELLEPGTAMLLYDFMDIDKLGDVVSRIRFPHPTVYVSGQLYSDKFYREAKPYFHDFIAAEPGAGVWVFGQERMNAVALLFEDRNAKKRYHVQPFENKNRLHYFEFYLKERL